MEDSDRAGGASSPQSNSALPTAGDGAIGAGTPTGSRFSNHRAEIRDGVIVPPHVQEATNLAPDEPQVIGASAPAPALDAWRRNEPTSPQERFDRATAARKQEQGTK